MLTADTRGQPSKRPSEPRASSPELLKNSKSRPAFANYQARSFIYMRGLSDDPKASSERQPKIGS